MPWPVSQVATGDLISAAQLNQLPITLAKLTGSAASYDFTSIPAHWTHLLLICALQTGSGNAFDDTVLRLNNDSTAAHYHNQLLRGSGATASSVEDLSKTSISIASVTGVSTGAHSSVVIWIPFYTMIGKRSVSATVFGASNNTTGTLRTEQRGGFWTDNATAVNRVTIIAGAGTFDANSYATLYGMGRI